MCGVQTISARAGRRWRARALTKTALGLNGAPGKGPKPMRSTRMASPAEYVGNLLDGGVGRKASRRDIGFDPRQGRLERPVGTQRREQTLFEHRPHPFHLLFAAPRSKLAGRSEPLAVVEDPRPQLRDAVAGQRRTGDD